MGVAIRRWPRIVVVAITLVAATALAIAVPVLNSLVIDTLIGARPIEMFPCYLGAMVAVYVLEPLLTFVYVRTLWGLGEEVVAQLRRDLFRALLVQRIEFFDRHRASELGALLSVELGSVRTLLTQNVSRDRGLRAACETLGTCTALFVMAPALAPVLDAAVVGFAAAAALYTRAAGPLFGRDVAAQGALSAGTATSLGAMRTVRSFGGEAVAFARFEADAGRAREAGLAVGRARALLECANRSCVYASLLTLFGVGGWLVQAGRVPVGALVAGVGYCFGLIFATQGVVNTVIDARAASAALGRARRLVTSTSPESALAAMLPTAVATPLDGEAAAEALAGGARGQAARAARAREAAEIGDIVFDAVCFSYPSRPSAEVLRDVSFTLPQGCVTALVGASGAGKTTVTQLLCRFYDPDAGAIRVGGADLSGFLRVDWRSAVALVGQDPVLFSGSVADNIRYGRAGAAGLLDGGGAAWEGVATDAEVEAAARAANAHDFITALPEGYATGVGELGGLLSGGQRQRIAIARAVLKDAPVLILDEATSALDATSEALVQAALRRLMRGRTTLVIAHRLATVREAEQIVVMGGGRVLEAGRHEELAARPDGVYSGLLASQRLSFVETLV